MKKLIFICLSLFAFSLRLSAQQYPPVDRTRENLVLDDRATWSRDFMRMPSGALLAIPAYVPDSLKCGAIRYKISPHVDTAVYVYNCLNSTWERLAKSKEIAALAANPATDINLGGHSVTNVAVLTTSLLNANSLALDSHVFEWRNTNKGGTATTGGLITSIANNGYNSVMMLNSWAGGVHSDSLKSMPVDSLKNFILAGIAPAISANTSNIATNTTGIAANTTGIAALQNRNINTGYGLTGGGNLTADRTLKADTITAIQTIANLFPRGDSRYYTKTLSDARYQPTLTAGNNIEIASNRLSEHRATTVYSGSYYKNYSDFTATGTTPTILSNAIELTGGTGSYSTQYLTLNNAIQSDENKVYDLVFKAVVLGTGIGPGHHSTISNFYAESVYVDVNTLANTVTIGAVNSGYIIKTATLPYTISAGDIIRVRYTQNITTITATVEDISKGTINNYSATAMLSNGAPYLMPSMGAPCIWNFGGTNDVISFSFISTTNTNLDVLVVGNSKTAGLFAGSWNLRFASQLSRLGTVGVLGANSAATADFLTEVPYIISLHPKYVILADLVRNDIAGGVPAATWQANYTSIVNSLTAAGITVVHLYGMDEPTLSQTAWYTWLPANFTSNLINILPGWNNSTMVGADGVHPIYFGHSYAASQIVNSGVIPLKNNYALNIYDYLQSPLSSGGTAASVMNGVYTTGSYANPTWITAIPYSILSGTVPTWNQNTTGNAATATTLASVRSIWGQNFNGSGNISGTLSNVANIGMSGSITFSAGNNSQLYNANGATTGYLYTTIQNTGGNTRTGTEGNVGGGLGTGTSAYSSVFGNAGTGGVDIIAGGGSRLYIDGMGHATFVSTVTGSSFIKSSATTTNYLQAGGADRTPAQVFSDLGFGTIAGASGNTVTHKIPIVISGTTYYILASTSSL